MLKSSRIFYVEYPDVSGLALSASVMNRGVQIGTVRDIYFKETDANLMVVELDIESDLAIPKNAFANIASGGLLEGSIIDVKFNQYCKGNNCAVDGDYLQGVKIGMVEGMLGAPPQDYLDLIKDGAGGIFDTLELQIKDPNNNTTLAVTLRELQATTENLSAMTKKLDNILGQSSNDLVGIFDDLDAISGNLKDGNAKITEILDNTAQMTRKFKEVDLDGTMNQLNGTMKKVDGTLAGADKALTKVQGSLSTVDKAVVNLDGMITKIKDSDGSLNRLITDDQLVKDLEDTLKSVKDLSEDLKAHPYNYIPLKSRRKVEKNRAKEANGG